MKAAETPENDRYRLDALRSLDLLDTEPEEEFDAIVRLGCELFGTPSCMVSLVDADRQWFKARVGLDASELPRAISFCGHAILHDDVSVVNDTAEDSRFADNPVVTGAPFVRFYAGAPILLPNGCRIGTVCTIAPTPRPTFSDRDRRVLADLATKAMTAIRARALRYRLDESLNMKDLHQAALYASPVAIACADCQSVIQDCNGRFADFCEMKSPIGQTINDAVPVAFADWNVANMYKQDLLEAKATARAGGEKLSIWRQPSGFLVIDE